MERAVSDAGRRRRSRCSAPPRPASAEITVRKAVAVRPPRPITLPRSSGWTRTSRIEPRRSCLSRTDVVGVVDDAADQVLERLGQHAIRPRTSRCRPRGGLGGRRPPRPEPPRQGLWRCLGSGSSAGASAAGASAAGFSSTGGATGASSAGVGLRRGLLLGGRPGLRLVGGVLERLVEDLGLVPLGLGHPQGALGARQALELLPVAGDLEDRLDGLGRLRADPQPVLRPVGGDLDERGLLLRVVLADLLDDLAVPLLAASRRRRRGSTADGSCPCASDES